MVHIPLPVSGASNSEANKVKSPVRRSDEIRPAGVLSDKHSSLPSAYKRNKKGSKSPRPEFYRYRKEQLLEDDLVYEDDSHPKVHYENDEHKGRTLDLNC